SGKLATFRESAGDLNIIPPAGSGNSAVRISIGPNGEVHRIDVDGRDMKTWTMGNPLLENLSAGNERRKMVTFQEIPPVLVNAVVSIEDKHFFHHRGLDLPRIAKAAY